MEAMEAANLPGFDYLEFKKSLQNLKKMDFSDPIRFQTAYATAQSMGVTPGQLQESAQHYLDVLSKEHKKFSNALSGQRAAQVNDKEAKLKQIDAEVKRQEAKIKELQAQIEKSRSEQTKLRDSIKKNVDKLAKTIKKYGSTTDETKIFLEETRGYHGLIVFGCPHWRCWLSGCFITMGYDHG